jgi:hypothetical protein
MSNRSDVAEMVKADFIKPTPLRFDTVEVSIDGEGFEPYIEEFVSLAALSGVPEVPLTVEELKTYVESLIYLRVAWVRGWKPAIRPYEKFAVPAFIAVALAAIGEAEDRTLGVRLLPSTKCKLQDTESFWATSRKLTVLAQRGFTMSEGLLRDQEGDWDTMCLQLLNQEVVCHSMDPHPSKAVVASALGIRWVNAVLNPRVKYGHTAEFYSILRHLAAPRSKVA